MHCRRTSLFSLGTTMISWDITGKVIHCLLHFQLLQHGSVQARLVVLPFPDRGCRRRCCGPLVTCGRFSSASSSETWRNDDGHGAWWWWPLQCTVTKRESIHKRKGIEGRVAHPTLGLIEVERSPRGVVLLESHNMILEIFESIEESPRGRRHCEQDSKSV